MDANKINITLPNNFNAANWSEIYSDVFKMWSVEMNDTTKQNLTFKIHCAGDVWITVSEFEYLMALHRGEKVMSTTEAIMTDTTKQAEVLCTQTDDAAVWAKEFCQLNPSMDEGNMIGWFANAIECSHDLRMKKRADLVKPIQAEPVATIPEKMFNAFIEDGNDFMGVYLQNPKFAGVKIYTYPAPALTAELREELLEILSEVTDPYAKVDGDQPKNFACHFGCHHNSETCMACEGMVKRWKLQKKIRAVITKLTNLECGS